MLNRDQFAPLVIPNEPLFNTSPYARVERAAAPTAWRAVLVYHLLPEQNGNQHTIFVDVLDTGNRWADTQGLMLGWTWEGRRADEPAPAKVFEKNPPEPRAQVDLYRGQITSVWIEDGLGVPSDRVHGLHSAVADVPGNNLFHNSFLVLFRLMTTAVVTPPVTPPIVVAPGPEEPAWTIEALAAKVLEIERRMNAYEGDGR